MISDWFAIFPDLAARPFCYAAIQLQLARNHRLREITFADEIWHNVNLANFLRIKEKESVTQAWLLFPKGAFNIDKNFSTPNLRRVRQRRRARVRVYRR